MKFNILLLGSGGREHAFAWKIAQSPHCKKLFIAPGNGGTLLCGTNIPVKTTDFASIKKIVIENEIDLVIPGPEDPLVNGIVDFFKADKDLEKIPVIGPSKAGAQLEGSKDFAKQFMFRHGIPTARYRTFTRASLREGLQFIESLSSPYVLKADGLAAGKGVVILHSEDDAKTELKEMLSGKFDTASSKVVIEEFLDGTELSVFIMTDGVSYQMLPAAKDYKRIGEGDSGLNTGGMGAVSPVPFADVVFMEKVEQHIIRPTLSGLAKEKLEYKGFIFFGLINVKGHPFVIEYNCRMGDPETEAVVPRMDSDLVEMFASVAENTLNNHKIKISEQASATVMLVSKGYPEEYETSKLIHGIEQVHESLVFQAGTRFENGQRYTSGGRVLAVTSLASSAEEALRKCYKSAALIEFENKYYRRDIGADMIRHSIV